MYSITVTTISPMCLCPPCVHVSPRQYPTGHWQSPPQPISVLCHVIIMELIEDLWWHHGDIWSKVHAQVSWRNTTCMQDLSQLGCRVDRISGWSSQRIFLSEFIWVVKTAHYFTNWGCQYVCWLLGLDQHWVLKREFQRQGQFRLIWRNLCFAFEYFPHFWKQQWEIHSIVCTRDQLLVMCNTSMLWKELWCYGLKLLFTS